MSGEGARCRGLLVTGTDTGVGKTVLSACLLAVIRAAGERVLAHKPVVTGLDDPEGSWPADDLLLGRLSGRPREQVAPLRYGPAVSPHFAAQLAGRPIDARQILDAARAEMRRAAEQDAILLLEGVGGLLVPLTDDLSVCDLATQLSLPVLIAARPGLGTISHTLLTLQAAERAGLAVAAVVMTPWAEHPSAMEISNRDTVARIGAVEVVGLPVVQAPEPAMLARAGATLPWRRWLRAATR